MSDNPPFNEWTPGFKASDIPITPGGSPSPFEEFPDVPLPEDEPYLDSDIDTSKVTVTFITDETGQHMRHVDMTLLQLAEDIRAQTAASKMALPWLKFALFGNRRSEKNSLRTNENVLQVTGIEVEHDSGEIAFGTALATVLNAGLRCILYTSPSYVPGVKERWRILLPLSKNYPPEWREKGVARVNGLFGGKLAEESFVLSQGYLYGSVNNNPDHRVEVIDGRFLDLRDELYAGSIFKDGSRVGGSGAANGAGSASHKSRKDDDPEPVDRDKIEAALDVIDSNCSYEIWLKVAAALHHALGEAGFEPFDRWSAKAKALYDAGESKNRWRGARTMHSISIATLFHYADEADASWRQRYAAWKMQRAFERMAAGAAGAAGTGTGDQGTNDYTDESAAKADAQQSQQTVTGPTPYVWVDPTQIPPRDWLYGKLLVREFVTATVAPGGLGKSSLVTVESLACAARKDLLGVAPRGRQRVWLWNLEDPRREIERKIQAAALHYGLKEKDIADWLFVDSGRERPLVVAKVLENGARIMQPVIDELVAGIIDRKIDVLVIDPFVSCHEVPENDNTMQDMIIKEWGKVADLGKCAVHLIDHTRKMGAGNEVNTESSRGAKAKTDAARVVRVLNRMTEEEGEKVGVDNHRLYFRTYNDKANFAPPADKSDWFEFKSVNLGNGLFGPGDDMGVVTRWQWPDSLAEMPEADFKKVAVVIQRGKWRADFQAQAWVGHAVAEGLGLDSSSKRDRKTIARALGFWIDTGLLVVVERPDERRRPKKFVELAEGVRG